MRGRCISISVAAVVAVVLSFAAVASAAPTPAWRITSVAVPTNFVPGGPGPDIYEVVATNLGAGATNGDTIKIVDTLPAGVSVEEVEIGPPRSNGANYGSELCAIDETGPAAVVTCEVPNLVPAGGNPKVEDANILIGGESIALRVRVAVPPTLAGPLENEAEISGGGAPGTATVGRNEATASSAPSGLSFFHGEILDEGGEGVTQAGSRPYQFTTSFAVNTEPGPPGGAPFVPAHGDIKDIEVPLPPGLIGNPTAVPTCSAEAFGQARAIHYPDETQAFGNRCPTDTAVGFARVDQEEGLSNGNGIYVPVYNLDPPLGMPAQLGFTLAGAPFLIDTKVRTGTDYGVTGRLVNVDQVKRVTAASVTLWGVPGDPSHDPLRGECLKEGNFGELGLSAGSCPYEGAPRPFLRMPTSCLGPLEVRFSFDTWSDPDPTSPPSATDGNPAQQGCSALDFSPSIAAVPDTTVSDSPTGLVVALHVPQHEGPDELAAADLRDAVVTLPRGMAVNPSGANGLVGCGTAQFGLTSAVGASPVTTTAAPASCPDGSKIGSVVVDTPLLDHPIDGSVYVADQGANPFNSLLAIYIAAYDPMSGVVLKLAGHVEADPTTGQVTTRFEDNPQLPFEDLTVRFFKGPRAPLRTPSTCGTYTTTTDLMPWSAPSSGPDATPSSAFVVGVAPGGGPCAPSEAAQPNQPSFAAGTLSPRAGRPSSFELHLRREDGSRTLRAVDVRLPQGLLARLAGIPYCPDPELAAAASRPGRSVAADPPCPASRVGSVTVGAGAGPDPVYVEGSAYLAGPYKGAPLSLAIVTPAVAGPFDLGTVVVRSALEVDPLTAQVSAVSDSIPAILQGIPLDVRTISLRIDRPNFTRNPTSCAVKQVTGSAIAFSGADAALADRFKATGCRSLRFRPRLKLRLKGATGRAGHPALEAVLTYPKKGAYADIARAQVGLPHAEFLDQNNLNKTCTRPVLLAGNCPKSSIYGRAKAWTPLLEKPLQGPVYLVGGFGYKLPALIADLNGQIRIMLKGRVDTTKRHGIRNTFEAVPDAPVSRFVLKMKGGKKYGLLENSENLCAKAQRASARFIAQNGRVRQWRPRIARSCRRRAAGKHRKRHRHG